MTGGLRGLVLVVRFLLELGLLGALTVWGFTVGGGLGAWLLGLGAPVLAAVVWGWFVAPKARRPVPVAARVAIELALFGAAAVALAATGRAALAVAFFALAAVISFANVATAPKAQDAG